jgi:protein-disulfide isomerase
MQASSTQARLALPVGPTDHIDGRPDAAVTLVEYGDYQCPVCGAAYPIVNRVREVLADRLRFVYRHFPLSQIHPYAFHAAEAAEAAGAQGKFWEMHDMLFENQQALTDRDLLRYAAALDLDVERFASDISSGAFAEKIREDFLGGVKSGVNGTPTFFINGVRHDGPWDGNSLLEAIERAQAAVPR